MASREHPRLIAGAARRAAKVLMNNRPLAGAVVSGLRSAGACRIARKLAYISPQVPTRLRIRLPDEVAADATFQMLGGPHRDQVARHLWIEGWQGFEPFTAGIFAAAASESAVVFDVGANTGVYTLIAGAVNHSSIIHAFEPYPPAREVLQANVQLNRWTDRVRLSVEAVSDSSGEEVEFFVPLQQHGVIEHSASLSKDFRNEHSEVLKVRTTTLDAYAEREKIERVGVMKIDVESLEHRVLAGAATILARHRPIVMIEVLPQANTEALTQVIQTHGYTTFSLEDDRVRQTDEIHRVTQGTNQILCPKEQVDRLKGFVRRAGYAFPD